MRLLIANTLPRENPAALAANGDGAAVCRNRAV